MGLFDRDSNGQYVSGRERKKRMAKAAGGCVLLLFAGLALLGASQDGKVTVGEANQVLELAVDGLEMITKSIGA